MVKIINYFIQSLLIYLFFLIGRILGLEISRKIFSLLFSLIGPFFKSKKIIKKNLEIFSQDISKPENNEITKNMWKNYGMTFIEYIFLNKIRKENDNMNIVGLKILQEIFKSNKPVIFISGHFANFEMMSMQITKKKIKFATIYRPLNNYFLNPFMEFLRRKYICKNQIRKGRSGVREAIQYIGRGYSIALMIDQRVSEGETINLFNQPALTTTLPAQLALKFNLNVVPVFIEREKDDSFKIKFYSPIDSSKFKNKFEFTKYLNARLEEMINKNPGQWIWSHSRWKL